MSDLPARRKRAEALGEFLAVVLAGVKHRLSCVARLLCGRSIHGTFYAGR